MDFKQRLEQSRTDWNIFKASKYITVYGPYNDGIKDILLDICEYLRSKGFVNAKIVEDYDDPEIDGIVLDWNQKSCYHIEHSDVNLFFFFKNTDNQSVALESNHALMNYDLLYRSLFFEEKEPDENYGAIKSVLGTKLIGKSVTAFPFDRQNVLKVAHQQLFSYLYSGFI